MVTSAVHKSLTASCSRHRSFLIIATVGSAIETRMGADPSSQPQGIAGKTGRIVLV